MFGKKVKITIALVEKILEDLLKHFKFLIKI
jgi:hypothetical protein